MAIKRARHIALLPYTAEHIRLAGHVASLSPTVIKIQAETPEVTTPEAGRAKASGAAETVTVPKNVESTATETSEPAPKAEKPAAVPDDVEPVTPEAVEPAAS
jgi:hypothetical protein